MLRAGDFGRVQAAVDVDERLALARQRPRLRFGQALRVRQPPRDLAVAIDLLEVLRRRDQREVIGAPLRRRAGFDQRQPIAGGIELLEIVDRLVVGGELGVGARREADAGVGRRDARSPAPTPRPTRRARRSPHQSHRALYGSSPSMFPFPRRHLKPQSVVRGPRGPIRACWVKSAATSYWWCFSPTLSSGTVRTADYGLRTAEGSLTERSTAW